MLQRLLRISAKLILALALLAGLAYGTWWWAVVRPHRQLEAMLQSRTATPGELRDAAHAALRFPSLNPHDVYLVLLDHGDASSVPVLIHSLRWQPHTPTHGRMICTKAHCLEALRKLTGRDMGKNYEDWAPLLDEKPTSRAY